MVICQNWSIMPVTVETAVHTPPTNAVHPSLTSSPLRHPAYQGKHPHSLLRTGSGTTETGSTRSSVEIMVQIIRECAKNAITMLIFPIHPKPAGASVLHHRRGIFWTQWGHQCG